MGVAIAHKLKSVLRLVCYFIIFVSHVLQHLEIMQSAPTVDRVVSNDPTRVGWSIPVSCWQVGLRYHFELRKSKPWIDCCHGPIFLAHLKPRVAS
jgi:hypothetical protein